jgi:hypothetical protein
MILLNSNQNFKRARIEVDYRSLLKKKKKSDYHLKYKVKIIFSP